MDLTHRILIIIGIFLFTLILNIFFGYFRSRSRKYSLKWFLYIHIPVPIVILARIYSSLDYRFIPVLLMAAVIGQILGGKLEI